KNVVDANGNIGESNENNNAKTQSLPVSHAAQYDLVPGDFTVTPSSPTDQSSITIQYRVINNGPDNIGAAFTSKLYIDDVYDQVCNFNNGANTGSIYTCERTGLTLSSGTHVLKNVVDADNNIGESNENNNAKTQSLPVSTTNLYDLMPYDFVITPSNPKDIDSVTIRYQVENKGPDNINNYFNFKLYINNILYQTCNLNSALAGYTYYCDRTNIRLTSGIYTIKNVVDADNNIGETNENNNVKTQSMSVGALKQYDLVASDFTVNPSSPYNSDSITIRYSMVNNGPDTISAPFNYKLYLNNELYQTCNSNIEILPNTNYYCERSGIQLSAGTYTLKNIIDTDNYISETSENNNVKTQSLTVTQRIIEYCGDGICNNGETWQICNSDCISPIARINVDVVNTNDYKRPLRNAKVLLDNELRGSTGSDGKFTFTTSYGVKEVKVRCPDQNFCDSKRQNIDGNKYMYFECACDLATVDSDADGLNDYDETVMGLDPLDSSKDLTYFLMPGHVAHGCFDYTALFSGWFSESEVDSMITKIKSYNSESFNQMFVNKDSVSIGQLLDSVNIPDDKLVSNQKTMKPMLLNSDSVKYVQYGANVIYFIKDKDTGVTGVFPILAGCAGQLVGILFGVGNGIKDDAVGLFDLGKMILEALWYLFWKGADVDKVTDFLGKLWEGLGTLFSNLGDVVHDVSIGIFEQGRWFLSLLGIYGPSDEYASFQSSFYFGYIIGYIIEQILLIELVIAKAGKIFSAISKGTKIGRVATEGARLIADISLKYGGAVAKTVGELKIWAVASKWGDKLVDGLARLAKHRGAEWFVGKSDDFIKTMSSSVSDLTEYYTKVCKLVPAGATVTPQSVQDCIRIWDDALAKLLSKVSDVVVKAKIDRLFAAWEHIAEAKAGLVRTFDKLGDEVLYKILKQSGVDDTVLQNVFTFVAKYDGSVEILKDASKVKYVTQLDESIIRFADDLSLKPGKDLPEISFKYTDQSAFYPISDKIVYNLNEVRYDPDLILDFTIGHELLHKKKMLYRGIDIEDILTPAYTYDNVKYFDEFETNNLGINRFFSTEKTRFKDTMKKTFLRKMARQEIEKRIKNRNFDQLAWIKLSYRDSGIMSLTEFDNMIRTFDCFPYLCDEVITKTNTLVKLYEDTAVVTDPAEYKRMVNLIAEETKNMG
ncbi:TPA: hypothetical protein HA246_03750, partial [Candidatus Woesearchaeota archaeon]|nr:hypothetical protein [Candidatus Woesearchaeota archaeon]